MTDLERNERAMLALIDAFREGECSRLLARAREEASELTRQAHREARRRLAQAVAKERHRTRSRIRGDQAELETHRRMHRQQRGAMVLDAAWAMLKPELRRRWADTESRQAWARSAARQALDRLPRDHWLVRHAPDWPEVEAQALLRFLEVRLRQVPAFEADPGIEAGLVISSDGSVLDASLRGLLDDRALIEARVLALLSGTGQS